MTEHKMTLEQLKRLFTLDGQKLPWIENISVVPKLALTKYEIEVALEIIDAEEETDRAVDYENMLLFKVCLQYTAWADFLVGKIQNGDGVGDFLDSYTPHGLRNLVDTYDPFSKNQDVGKRKEFTGKVCDFLTEKYWS
jgi:hypothetical protein